jgi:hypothetical protein
MVCFVNVESVDRIIYSFSRDSTGDGKLAPSTHLHKQLGVTQIPGFIDLTVSRT